MKRDDLELIAGLCRRQAGLKIDLDKLYLVESRLSPLARRLGYASIAEMVGRLRDRREETLAWAMVEAMTLNETAFYRDRPVFDFLAGEALPKLAARRAPGEPLRVWSAGCATGQELYSLAMQIDAGRGDLGGVQVELLGSDISERCLEKARAGLYTQFEIQRGLPIRQLVEYFEKQDEHWRLSPRIRQMVRWRRVNLLSDLAPLGRFDVILCRNVLNQMEDAFRTRALEAILPRLAPDGLLVLGAHETATIVGMPFVPLAGRQGLYARNPGYRAAA